MFGLIVLLRYFLLTFCSVHPISVGQACMLCLVLVTYSACVGSIHPRRLPKATQYTTCVQVKYAASGYVSFIRAFGFLFGDL